MPTEEECSKCQTNSGGGWKTILVFLVLIFVIALCAYNITAYSDILNGNLNAPDITPTTCNVMLAFNGIIIILCSISIILTLKRGFDAIKDSGVDYYEKIIKSEDGDVVELYGSKPGMYVANRWGVQLWLWIFSTVAMVVVLLNAIQMTKLDSGDNPDAVNPGGAFVAFNWIVFVLTLVYWLYTSFRTLIPKKTQYYLVTALKNPKKSGLIEKLKSSPTLTSVAPGAVCLPKKISKDLGIKEIGSLSSAFTI